MATSIVLTSFRIRIIDLQFGNVFTKVFRNIFR